MKYVNLIVFIWNKIAWRYFRVVFFPCSPGESFFVISNKIKYKKKLFRNKNPKGVMWILCCEERCCECKDQSWDSVYPYVGSGVDCLQA